MLGLGVRYYLPVKLRLDSTAFRRRTPSRAVGGAVVLFGLV